MGTVENTEEVFQKICSKCKIEKSSIEFNISTSSKDGRQRYCRECNKMYGRRYYIDKSPDIKEQRKQAALTKKQLLELERIRKERENAA